MGLKSKCNQAVGDANNVLRDEWTRVHFVATIRLMKDSEAFLVLNKEDVEDVTICTKRQLITLLIEKSNGAVYLAGGIGFIKLQVLDGKPALCVSNEPNTLVNFPLHNPVVGGHKNGLDYESEYMWPEDVWYAEDSEYFWDPNK